ncbi:hypothetical protein BH09SUM1_BH09SUM1_14180 [soil metagenome]
MNEKAALDSAVLRGVRRAPALIGHRRGYRVMDRLARVLEPRLRGMRTVQHAWGSMEYDLDQYVERLLAYELFGEELPSLMELLLLRPGDVFVDAGANIGYITVRALSLVGETGRVISFEAHPGNRKRLLAAISRVGAAERCDTPEGALFEKSGEIVKFFCLARGVDSTLAANGEGTPVEIPTITFDDVVAGTGAVRLLKIDIEGAEMTALRGGMRWLGSDSRPQFIYSELNPRLLKAMNTSAAELHAFYCGLGYRPWDVAWAGRGWKLKGSRFTGVPAFESNGDFLYARGDAEEAELARHFK